MLNGRLNATQDVFTLTVKRATYRRSWTPGMFVVTWMGMLMDVTLVLMLLCFASFAAWAQRGRGGKWAW